MLANSMRPRFLNEVVGQEEIKEQIEQIYKNSLALDSNANSDFSGVNKNCWLPPLLPSLIFSGSPGIGKTTLARIYTRELEVRFGKEAESLYHFVELAVGEGTTENITKAGKDAIALLSPPSQTTLQRAANNLTNYMTNNTNSRAIAVKERSPSPTRDFGLFQQQQKNSIPVPVSAKPKRTVVFIDELQRLSKLQQDRLLSFIENGTFIFIGATTQDLIRGAIPALRSRCKCFELKPLESQAIGELLLNAIMQPERSGLWQLHKLKESNRNTQVGLADYNEYNINSTNENIAITKNIDVDWDAIAEIAVICKGDARNALSALEMSIEDCSKIPDAKYCARITAESVRRSLSLSASSNSAAQMEQIKFESVSAVIKSIRASDPQGAIFFIARMLYYGIDPMYIARRLVVSASEDVGLGNPHALVVSMSCLHAVETIGMPEARIILASTAIYLAKSPKSNSAIRAIDAALELFNNKSLNLSVEDTRPRESYRADAAGEAYRYPFDYGGYIGDTALPDRFKNLLLYNETTFEGEFND